MLSTYKQFAWALSDAGPALVSITNNILFLFAAVMDASEFFAITYNYRYYGEFALLPCLHVVFRGRADRAWNFCTVVVGVYHRTGVHHVDPWSVM